MKRPVLSVLVVVIIVAQICCVIGLAVAFDVVPMIKYTFNRIGCSGKEINLDRDLLKIRDIWGRYGFMDHQSNVILWPSFSGIDNFSEGLAGAEIGDKWGYIDKTGVFKIKPQFGGAYSFENGLAKIQMPGFQTNAGDFSQSQQGIINKKGDIMLEPQYGQIFDACDGMIQVVNDPDWYGYLDTNYHLVIPQIYGNALSFQDNFAYVCDKFGGGWGLIDKKGQVVVPFKYSDLHRFSNKYVAVQDPTSKLWGIADMKGALIVPYQYSRIESWIGLSRVQDSKTNLWGFIDKYGALSIPCEYEYAADFSEGLAAVEDVKTKKWGFIDINGSLVIPYKYSLLGVYEQIFRHGIFCVKAQNGKNIIIDKTGRCIMEGILEFEYLKTSTKQYVSFGEAMFGYAGNDLYWAVLRRGWLTFFDKQGNIKFETKGDEAGQFSEGLCSVYIEDKSLASDIDGYIDMTGKRLIDYRFSNADDFQNGIACVGYGRGDNANYGYIDKAGKWLWLPGSLKLLALKIAVGMLLLQLVLTFIIIRAYDFLHTTVLYSKT